MVKLDVWRSNVSLRFTWLFHGTKVLYFFFLLFILYKYGSIHLGRKSEQPEFSTPTYSAMIFTAGVSNALLVYSVSEPLSLRDSNFYAMPGYRSQDELDMFAINLAVTDWGFGSWATYTLVAVTMSLAVHRFRLPMTYRSCFYPILGAYTWGWMGDALDSFAIVATLMGIFINLGLLASNLVAGFTYMEWIDIESTAGQLMRIENTIIWVITVFSLVSVLSGLHGGVKLMCIFAMGLAILLAFLVFIMEDTPFILNLQVQEVGSYLQNSIFELNFWTDAFGQLREGSGRAIDGKAAEQWWFMYWLNFSQSWWYVCILVAEDALRFN
jgi:choline/glycine/proline betaine transport protein